ncbi:MAG: hypothetical protein ACREDE_09835 [Thermoplasmata archaeon]
MLEVARSSLDERKLFLTDLRWPEYVQTRRGEEWWLPTPHQGSGAGDLL